MLLRGDDEMMSAMQGAGTHALSLSNYREMNWAKRNVCSEKVYRLLQICMRLTAVVFALGTLGRKRITT
jgi:hypothetical protein